MDEQAIFELPEASEVRGEAIDMKMTIYSHANKTHFSQQGFCTYPLFES